MMTAPVITSTTAAAVNKLAPSGKPRPRTIRNAGDRLFFWVLRIAASLPILLMIVFLLTLCIGAWPSIKTFGVGFLFSSEWDPNPDREQYGALAFIYGTLFSSIFALAIAAPIGIGVAAFMHEVFPARLRSIVSFLIEILATIPSIVYGVWAFFVLRAWVRNSIQPPVVHAMTALHWLVNDPLWVFPAMAIVLFAVLWPMVWLFKRATAMAEHSKSKFQTSAWFVAGIAAILLSLAYGFFGMHSRIAGPVNNILGPDFVLFRGPPLGLGLLTGTLVLATMILPIIVSISLDAIRSVPNSYREAALGLGATRWEMIRLAVLPAARSGLVGACILAFGRALGETMAITMVIGNANKIGWSLFQPANTIASVVASQYGEAADLMLSSLIELALILFVMTLIVNLCARSIIGKLSSQKGMLA